MERVVIIGPGASGKSTLAAYLGDITALHVIELDKVFWRPRLVATPHDQWVEIQQTLADENGWIMDGDWGPYDAVEVRLRAADTNHFLGLLDSPIRLASPPAITRARRFLALAVAVSTPQPSVSDGGDR